MAQAATLEQYLTVTNNYRRQAINFRKRSASMFTWARAADIRIADQMDIEAERFEKKARELLPEDKKLVTNIMSGLLVIESKDTPYTCSVASETYWCS